MNDQNRNGGEGGSQNGSLGMLFGVFVALGALFFIASGGSLGGKKTIENDADLPPVATGASPATTTGQGVR